MVGGSGNAGATITSGLKGAWTSTPAKFSIDYLNNLFAFEWVQTKSPAGATQWVPANNQAASMVPDAHDPSKRHAPIMFTTDLALKADRATGKKVMSAKGVSTKLEAAVAVAP